jgi:Flp pilus assembly protein TadD
MGRGAFKTWLAVAALAGLLAGCGAHQADSPRTGMNAEARLRVADAAEASGDHGMAVSMFTAAAELAPNDTAVQLRCAEGLTRNGQPADAMMLLNKRLQADPRQPDALRTLGAIQVMTDHPAEAVQTLAKVLKQNPNDVKALTDTAVALDLLHQHDQAQALYRKALDGAPDDLAVRNDLALSLLLSRRPEEARQVLLPLRDMAGLPERIRINLGIADAASGHLAEAEPLLHGQVDDAGIALLTRAIDRQGAKGSAGSE